MPGAYAHITLVNEAANAQALRRAKFPQEIVQAIQRQFKFAELGAVSPDYPYLDLIHPDAKQWADQMHYEATDGIIRASVPRIIGQTGDAREKAIAWILGYTSHVVGDVTIHPVIELKVGPYAQNQRAHRVCEMNQDVYIFRRLNIASVQLAEHLDSGIKSCVDDDGVLDSDIRGLWRAALQETYPTLFGEAEPEPRHWHEGFGFIVDKIAEEGGQLLALARHVLPNDPGITYPSEEDIDRKEYIEKLNTPVGELSYDEIFNRAIRNIQTAWSWIASAIANQDDDALDNLGSWNLDTGRDTSGRLVMWE